MFQKGLAPIVIVLILAGVIALVGGAYYLGTRQAETFQERLSRQNPVISPSINDETAGWKTYTDPTSNFSFKYPPDWNISGNKIEENVGNSVDSNILTQKGVSIKVYKNAGNLVPLDFLEKVYYKDFTGDAQILKDTYMKTYKENIYSKMSTVVVDSRQVTYIDELILPRGSDGEGVLIPINQDMILLRSYPSTDFENQQKIFNQILSTFKFLK